MECPSCEFQNMPGSGRCARCGASLALATAAIDVHPPRAGRFQRNMPQFWGVRRLWGQFVEAATRPIATSLPHFEDVNFDLGTMLRTIVPGWAHAHRGRRERGVIFLVSYLVFLVPGILLMGTIAGSILVGLAFGAHVMSAVDAMVSRFSDFAGRAAFSLFCGLGLVAIVYWPIAHAISRVATPIRITQPVADFERGDVLWYNRSADIRPGDIVYYEMPQMTIAGQTAAGHAANYVFRDAWINRVAAVAGQTVSWKNGQMFVDGEPYSHPDSVPVNSDGDEFVVPDGRVFIPAGSLLPIGVDRQSLQWHQLELVREISIHGTIFFRSLPLRRLSAIH